MIISRAKQLSNELLTIVHHTKTQLDQTISLQDSFLIPREISEMEYEDARSRYIQSSYMIHESSERITNVMLFSKQLLNDYQQEENQLAIDNKQSYEYFEDAEGWKGLNMKRKLEKSHLIYINIMNDKYKHYNDMNEKLLEQKELVQIALIAYNNAITNYEHHYPFINTSINKLNDMKIYLRELLSALVTIYSMPR